MTILAYIYFCVPSFLWPYFMKLIDPQNGHCLISKELINSISSEGDSACLALYHSWTVFSTRNCPLDLLISLDHVNERKDGYFLRSFLFIYNLAVRSFTRWITRTAKSSWWLFTSWSSSRACLSTRFIIIPPILFYFLFTMYLQKRSLK